MPTLGLLDYAVLAGYFAAVILIGVYFSRRQTTTREYFLAGKSMSWLPLGISMYATLFSSITYMSLPAESFQHNVQYFMVNLAVPVAAVITVVVFVDVYSRLNITTIFEFIEMRFNGAIRILCAGIYCAFRCLYAGIVLFTLSLALSVTTGIPIEWVLISVGLVSIVYTLLGGMEAVIWTDVMQFCVLFGGVALTLVFVSTKLDGGFATLFQVAQENHKFKIVNPTFSLTERMTFWGILAAGLFGFLGNKGSDQLNVQRYLSGKSVGQSKGALILAAFVSMPVQALLYMVGIGLFVYYVHHHPDLYVSVLINQGEHKQIFPYFIVSGVPVGLRGLLLGGLLAAAMSTVDSVLNTLSATSVTDFYRRWIRPDASPARQLLVSKGMIVFWGVVITAASFAMRDMQSILKTTASVMSVFMGQLLGVFLLGVLVKRATGWGTLIGAVAGQVVVLLVKFNRIFVENGALAFSFRSGVADGLPGKEIQFIWYSGIGTVVTLAVGLLASLLFKPHDYDKIIPVMWQWKGWKAAFGSVEAPPPAGAQEGAEQPDND